MNALSKSLRLLLLNDISSQHQRHAPIAPSLPAPQVPATFVHNGLNFNDLRDRTVPVAVQVYINENQIGLGDIVDLLWNGIAVGSQSVTEDNLTTARMVFLILPLNIPNGTAVVNYHVTGFTGLGELVSYDHPPFLVKRSLPGGPDPLGNTPDINENLPLPTIKDSAVEGGKTVEIYPHYLNIAEGDVLTLHWGSDTVPIVITAEQVLNPQLPLTIEIPANIIAANPGLVGVTYEIRDTVKNWSLFSLETTVEIGGPAPLLAPSVRDANDDGTLLDVDALNGARVAIQITVSRNLLVFPCRLRLKWTGQTLGGITIFQEVLHEVTVTANRITLWVDNIKAAALVGSSATISYEAYLDESYKPVLGQTRYSESISVGLTGEPVTLAKPSLTNVTGDTYNPDTIAGTHQEAIVPPYTFMAVGQSVMLIWQGVTANGAVVYETRTVNIESDAQLGAPISFQIEKHLATVLAGGSLKVSYKVTADGVQYSSQALALTVDGQVNTLPPPTTEPVFANGEVDPNVLGDVINVIVQANGILLPGDLITVNWHGKPDASTNPTASFPATGDLSVPIATRPFITGNANTFVEVWYTVWRNNAPFGSSRVLTLHIGELGQVPWPAPIIIDATGSQANPVNPIKPGTTDEENTATVVIVDTRLKTGDKITVLWQTANGDLTIPNFVVVTPERAEVLVPREVFAASMGLRVQLLYVVLRNTIAIGTSPAVDLRVSPLPQSAYPTPFIAEADAWKVLDSSTFTGNATLKVAPWIMISEGMVVWVILRGTLKNGSPWTLRLYDGYQLRAQDIVPGLSRAVLRDRLAELDNYSSLSVEMKVAFDGNTDETQALPCPGANYIFRSTGKFLEVTEFRSNNWNGWKAGPAASDPRDLSYVEFQQNPALFNNTFTNNSAGIVMYKDFSKTFIVGKTYQFYMHACDYPSRYNTHAFLWTSVDSRPISPAPVDIGDSTHWVPVVGTFVATSTAFQIQVNNNTASGLGNDYIMSWFSLTEL